MQQIQLNIIPFKPVVDNQTFAFYGKKQKGFAPIYRDKLFESFHKGREARHENYCIDYHFPKKVSIKATIEGLVQDVEVIRELINQVYQFSRMYWKSTNQQSLPVTIKYPEIFAEIFPHFEHNHLLDFGKENLWFM
jgi:hypothetical protein